MKKTTKLLAAAALLLAALMLFSACSITYRKADTAKYIQLAEDAYRKVTLAVDKMVVDADDVAFFINDLRYQNKKDVKSSTDNSYDNAGPVAAFDVLTLRYALFDEVGNLVSHNFNVDTSSTDTSELALANGLELPIGFWPIGDGSSLNTGLSAWLETQLYGDGSSPVDYGTHVFGHKLAKDDGFDILPEVLFCTYTSTYGNKTAGKSASSATPIHIASLLEKDEQGKNSYNEAIALGLKQVIETFKGDKSKFIKPTDQITINVYPTTKGVPSGAKVEADAAHIAYDLDFSDIKAGESYDEGQIVVTIKGATVSAAGSSAFIPTKTTGEAETYTYPEDTTGKYQTEAGDTHDLKNTKCKAYVYFESRIAYDYPAYDADFIKTTAGFASEETDLDKLKAEYEESVRADLQEDCDRTAKKKAMSRLWDTVVASTELLKTPTANIRAYQKNELNYFKYLYYDYGYSSSSYYSSFEDFVVKMYSASGTSYTSFDAVKNAIWSDGVRQAKENLLTYYLADALEVRLTEAQLDEKLQAYAAKLALDRVEELRETKAFQPETGTPEEKEAIKQANERRKAWLEANGFTDASQIPDDFFTAEDVLETIEDDKDALESILGGFQLDTVLEKLYEINLAGGTLTHPHADYDESKLVG